MLDPAMIVDKLEKVKQMVYLGCNQEMEDNLYQQQQNSIDDNKQKIELLEKQIEQYRQNEEEQELKV